MTRGEKALDSSGELTVHDRWILSRLDRAAGEVNRHLERFDLGEGARELYDFVWSELCDWYIELIKPRALRPGRRGKPPHAPSTCCGTCWRRRCGCCIRTCRSLTEDIWQRMYKAIGAEPPVPSIMVTPWPTPAGRRDEAAEREVEMLTEIVRGIRNIRAEQHVEPGRRIDVVLQAPAERRGSLEVGGAVHSGAGAGGELGYPRHGRSEAREGHRGHRRGRAGVRAVGGFGRHRAGNRAGSRRSWPKRRRSWRR